MGVLKALRRVGGFLLGPARTAAQAAASASPRVRASDREQRVGDAAAPWWIAEVRKLWVWCLGFVLVWVHQASGWDFTGLFDQFDGAVWGPLLGWLQYRVANRRG